MLKKIDALKNKNLIIISVVLSLLFVFLWIMAGTFPFGKTEKAVFEYTSWDTINVKGYDVEGNNFCRTDKEAYLEMPSGDVVDRVSINVDSVKPDDISIKIYYVNKDGKYTTNTSLTAKPTNKGEVSFLLPDVSSRIKIKIDSNINENITINKISLYKSDNCLNKRFIISVGIAIIICFIINVLLLHVGYSFCTNNIDYFFLTLIVGGVLYVAIALVTNNYYWGSYFFSNPKDAFMDHFNMLMLSNNADPYVTGASYPALCFVILRWFFVLLPLNVQRLDTVLDVRANAVAISVFLFVVIACALVIYLLLKKILGADFTDSKVALLIFTGPLLYVIQRGNILLLAFIFLLIFFNYYDSEDRRLRYLAYVALALAASIKVYPAVFGFMVIRKKRYKEAGALAALGLFSFLLPFFAYDGIRSLKKFFAGLSKAGEVMSSHGLGQNISLDNMRQYINAALWRSIPSSQVTLIIINLLLVGIAIKAKKEWHAWFMLAVVCAWYPMFSFNYVLLLFYPAIIMAMKSDKNMSKIDCILLGVLLLPLGLPYFNLIDKYTDASDLQMNMSISSIVTNLIIVYWVIRIVYETIVGFKDKAVSEKCYVVINRVIAGILVILTLGVLIVGYTRPYDTSVKLAGEGTAKHPYEISSVDDFMYLVKSVNSGETFSGAYFVQTLDIQFDGSTSIDPIGWDKEDAHFSGVYNGQGHSIIDYYALSPDDQNMGVFGVLDGEVYNLNLKNCNIAGNIVGGIAYEITSNGKIENCYVNGIITGYQVGGVAAVNYGTIENCVTFVNIDATDVYSTSQDLEDGVSVNNYSNSNKKDGALNADTIAKINSHVDRANSALFSNIKLFNWSANPDYFMTLSTE